ncbi:PAS domain-containing protein [Halobacteria archaeon AArc-dxtr1]|nr:PAS domain-containing protein [Halobacteria archaeon AArc-dxtr1]
MHTVASSTRVLHVDDDPSTLELTAEFLNRELSNPTVVSETSAEAALDRLLEGSFDCVISDYDMPEQTGLEFFEAICDADVTIPFVLYTGKGSEEIASQALNAGVTGYFQKGGADQQRRLANRVGQAVEESQTQEVAKRYATVLKALGYPIYVIDESGRFEFVNELFAELTGYDRETILGSSPSLMKSPEGVEKAEAKLGSILSEDGTTTEQFDIEIHPREGTPIPCRDHMAALPYDGESFEGSVGILRDRTEERRRERDLEYKTQAMDEAPIGITMSDPSREDNPMVYINEEFEALTGYDREASLGRNCRFLQGEQTEPAPVNKLREGIDAGEPAGVELRNYRRNGEQFWNRVSIAPIKDAEGMIVRWVGFQQDVTDREEHQRALEQQNKRLDEFASIVSHDLKNPLTLAKGRLELARDECDNEHLDAVDDALAWMECLIEDLLQFAQAGQDLETTEAVDLAAAADTAWKTAADGHEQATLAIVETMGGIEADETRLRQLLENLFSNAIEHAGSDVTVSVGQTEDGFYVEDDGPGIPAGDQTTVFDAGHSSSSEGTGFGLSIVEQVADAHGWSISLAEGRHGGARFEIGWESEN